MAVQPYISIITVTFNAESVIEKTMNSLSQQSYQDFEHIVIDGNSSDSTLEIIKKYNLSCTKFISETDDGLYDAMNKGLHLATGKYVIFLNAGDTFHSYDTLARYSEKLNDFDIIYGDTDIYDINGNYQGPRHISVPKKLTTDSFSQGMLICHQAFMVKKELAPDFNLKYRFSADYDWCLRCIKKGNPKRFCNLNIVTINYLNDGLTDKNKWKSLKERFKIMANHYGYPLTLLRHFQFIGRAIKRGKI